MKKICTGAMLAVTAASLCMVAMASQASARTIITTEYDSFGNPIVLTEPAVVETAPVVSPTVVTSPTLIESQPMIMPLGFRRRHLLHVGVPGLMNFSLF